MKLKKKIPVIDQVDELGFWGGKFGGNFCAETLKKPIEDLEILSRDILWILVFAALVLIIALLPKKDVIGKFKGFFLLLLYCIFIILAFTQ